MTNAMMNIPEEMVRIKVGVIVCHELGSNMLDVYVFHTYLSYRSYTLSDLTSSLFFPLPQVTSANAFAQTLRRYTSLNHLAQAARAVLQNTAQINQMLSDLNRVDFANVQVRTRSRGVAVLCLPVAQFADFFFPPLVLFLQEQASWVCRCEDRVVQRLEQDFKLTLQQQNSLEQWAAWLDGVVSQVLKPYQHSPAFPKAAKLFLLKWSFYR